MIRGLSACVVLLLAACVRDLPEPSPCEPDIFGLRTTRSGLDWLESAVADANALLAQRGAFQLQLMTDGAAPAESDIPVWPVAEIGLTPMQTAWAPAGCRAVFIQTVALAQRVAHWNGDDGAGLSIEPAAISTWVLLHEVGHIHDLSTGQIDPAPAVRGRSFSGTLQKRRELSADAYAAGLIRMPEAGQSVPAFMASIRMRLALTQLSWNLQRDRQLGLFGSLVLATPEAFGDVGDTHPNLELRVLITQVLIDDTEEARALLDDFESARLRAAKPSPRVLYDSAEP